MDSIPRYYLPPWFRGGPRSIKNSNSAFSLPSVGPTLATTIPPGGQDHKWVSSSARRPCGAIGVIAFRWEPHSQCVSAHMKKVFTTRLHDIGEPVADPLLFRKPASLKSIDCVPWLFSKATIYNVQDCIPTRGEYGRLSFRLLFILLFAFGFYFRGNFPPRG